MSKQPINIRLDRELLDATDALAASMGIARTELIERGLRRELLHDGQREFVYVLLDAARTVRYVGRAKDPYRRLREHIAGARAGGHSAKERWLASLLDAGGLPHLVIIDDAESGDAIAAAEGQWIEHFKANGTLTNGVRGGVASQPTHHTTVRLPPDLTERIDKTRGLIPREAWVRRELEAALSETNGAASKEQVAPAPVPSHEGVRATAPPRASDRATRTIPDRTEAFRQATTRKTTP